MHRSLLTLIVMVTLVTNASAQPEVAMFRLYHNDRIESFRDIYPPENGGYIMCGRTQNTNRNRDLGAQMWVARVDENGDIIWTETYGDPDDTDKGISIIEIDAGGFLIGGETGVYPVNERIAAWRLNDEGEQMWFRTYGRGTCHAVLEIEADEFLLTGVAQAFGFLICVDGDGELLWEEYYNRGTFRGMCEADDSVVLAGYLENRDLWVLKANLEEEGEVVWNRNFSPYEENTIKSIVSAHDNGFILSGRSLEIDLENRRIHSFMTFKIDDDGNQNWSRNYDISDQTSSEMGDCIEKFPQHGYVIAGSLSRSTQGGLIRITSQGDPRWDAVYDNIRNVEGDWILRVLGFTSVIIDQQGSVVCTGAALDPREGGDRGGFVLKLEPEILGPQFIYNSPENTFLTVLQRDTVQFIARAVDRQEEEITYIWTIGDDTLSTDTTTSVIFDETGEFEVLCQVSNGEFTISKSWNVSVMEWYIDFFQPDSNDIAVRRRTSIDFTHHTRAIDDREFDYRWEHFGRGGDFEFDGEDSVRFNFDLTGDHIIRAAVQSGDEMETVEWDINVHSIIWWWWPHENELIVQEDTSMTFEVFPFNEESDSLEYTWCLNEERLEVETSEIEIPFPEVGVFEISTYVQDGIESDTIRWTVDVLERSFTANEADLADLPNSPVLYPPGPNPFNSTTNINIFLPVTEIISLSLYDLQGRLVKLISENMTKPGYHAFSLNGTDLSTGIYILSLKTSMRIQNQKLALVR